MRPCLIAVLLSLTGCAASAPTADVRPAWLPALEWSDEVGPPAAAGAPRASVALEDGHGTGHTLLLYLPNRLFDLLDIVRARLRLGPGLAFDVRATEAADLFVGAYASIFVGIPGPRGEPRINWPVGLESLNGAELSFLDISTGLNAPPGYGVAEFGLGAQLLLIGADIGVDPWEALDFLAGILTIDPGHDDL